MFLGLKFMHQRNKSFERESSTPSGNGVAVKPAYEGKGNGSLSFPFFKMSAMYFTKTLKNKNWKNWKDIVNYTPRQK